MLGHLPVHRVGPDGPAGDLRLDLGSSEVDRDALGNLAFQQVPLRRVLAQHPFDLHATFREQRVERPVLQLPPHQGHPQAVCQRGEDLQGLPCLLLLAGGWQEADRLQVLQPVRQLEDQRTQIAGPGDELIGFGVGAVEIVECCQALNERCDLRAERVPDHVGGVAGVVK